MPESARHFRTWMYWEQGFETAPQLVKLCRESWAAYSDDLVCLDRSTLSDHLTEAEVADLFQAHIPVQMRSDLIRLKLLLRYGGIWADATVLCVRDYHEWLAPEMSPFPVLYPNTDRLISNWVIYAHADDPVLKRLHDHLWRVFVVEKHKRWEDSDGSAIKTLRRLAKSILKKIRTVTGVEYWKLISTLSAPAMVRLLGGYPYLLFHFAYARIVLNMKLSPPGEPHFIPAVDAHRLQNHLRKDGHRSAEEIMAILSCSPVHKLAHDLDMLGELTAALGKTCGGQAW